MTDQPLLGDGTLYVPGMPLWDMFGNPVSARWFEVCGHEPERCTDGWYLGGISLLGFYVSRQAWSRQRMVELRDAALSEGVLR